MISVRHMALVVALLGLKAFALGIAAERRKPESGMAVIAGGIVTCKYPSDPSVILGFGSIVLLTAAVAIGIYAVFYPYQGKAVPVRSLFQTTTMVIFFQITLFVSMFAEVMLLWSTISELKYLINNSHQNLNAKCLTAPTGIFGGGAFMALNASLFWMVCLMLTENAREDHFADEEEDADKGKYRQVLTEGYEPRQEKSSMMVI